MQKLIFIILAVLFVNIIFGQDTLKIDSDIKNVTIYRQGAQIKRTASEMLEKGRTTLVLKDLTSNLDKNTIKVKANSGVTVVSVVHTFNYMNLENSNKQIKKLKLTQERFLDSTGLYKKYLIVLNDEKGLLQANRSIGGSQNGVDIQNLKATAEFYRTRMKEIELQILAHNNKIKKYNLGIIKLARQLNELNAKKDFTTSDLIVVLSLKKKQKVMLDFEYFVTDAGWKPYYDVRVADVNNPVKIVYKAKIRQNTDIDWEDVKLTLSTGNPSVSGFKPTLTTYFLAQNNYYRGSSNISNQNYSGYVRGKVTDDTGEALPGVTVIVKGTDIAAITDLHGNYSINAPLQSDLVFWYIGFNDFEQKVVSSGINVMLSSDTEIEEVVVTALGMSREEKSLGYAVQDINMNTLSGRVAGVNITNSGKSNLKIRGASSNYFNTAIPLNLKKHETNREFVIDIPYTIRSDNKEYDVTMTEFELLSEYKHYAVPKLTEKVFLTALLTEWQDFGMLNGNANVFFKETYTGKTYLDIETLNDTLILSLGIDNDIFIKREQIKDYTETKFLGANRKESRAWKISIKNLKGFPVKLIVEDQLPVAKNNKIKVEKIEISNAEEDEESGLLKWTLLIEPSKSEELLLKYSVKYPSGLRIIVD